MRSDVSSRDWFFKGTHTHTSSHFKPSHALQQPEYRTHRMHVQDDGGQINTAWEWHSTHSSCSTTVLQMVHRLEEVAEEQQWRPSWPTMARSHGRVT